MPGEKYNKKLVERINDEVSVAYESYAAGIIAKKHLEGQLSDEEYEEYLRETAESSTNQIESMLEQDFGISPEQVQMDINKIMGQ